MKQQNVIIIKSFESCYEIYVEHNWFHKLQYIKKSYQFMVLLYSRT